MMLQLTHPDLVYAHAQARHAELLAEAATRRRASQLPPRPTRSGAHLAFPAWLSPRRAPAPSTL